MSITLESLKETGNDFFKKGSYVEALSCYIEALSLNHLKDSEKAVLFKNKAACNLKLEKYSDAINDSSNALDICSNDPKALFRRSQALERLGRLEEAYKDAVHLIKVDPKNTAILPTLQRLTPVIQERIKEQNSTQMKVSQMFEIAFQCEDDEKRLQGLNNLLVLAKDDAGATDIHVKEGISKLTTCLQDKNPKIIVSSLRVLSQLCNGKRHLSLSVNEELTRSVILFLYQKDNQEIVQSLSYLLQNIITYISGVTRFKDAIKKYNEERSQGERPRYPQFTMDDESQIIIDEIFNNLTKLIINGTISALSRDSILDLLMANLPQKDAIGWTKKFIKAEGVQNLMVIAGSLRQHKLLKVTENSSMHASLALSKVYDDLQSDQDRQVFQTECENYFRELLGDESLDSKVEAIEAVSVLLQGPFDVGNMLLGITGVSEMMLALAQSDNVLHKRVAVEAIVHSASKKDKCSGMLKEAVPILKSLYKCEDDHIKVRSLVGMCKLASFSGTDASDKPMADGSALALSKGCRKFLRQSTSDLDTRKWAVEGLAYLTLDADIKEELISDTSALTSLVNTAKEKNSKTLLYSAVTVFVNLTNSYDQPDIPEEMIQLAKYAKQHVPETHPMDKPEAVKIRVAKLAEFGVVSALVSLSSTDSKNTRELLARIYMSLASDDSLRGGIVQQGGVKCLLQLCQDNTDAGRILAAHSLAKIGVTMNPTTAFHGQRVLELVRPLLSLLHPDRTGLQNFEALMALTNITSISDEIRTHVVKERGFSSIEHMMFEEHDMIRRAATECMCNLVMNQDVVELFKGENDRVKMLTLFCGEEDELLVRAASGGLAVLTQDPDICRKVIQVNNWLEYIQSAAANENKEIQHRGCYILQNLIGADDKIAKTVIESTAFEILMAVSLSTDASQQKSQECAKNALNIAQERGLIKAT